MPWRCPACQTVIRHPELQDRPVFGVNYRCHVCRLDLVLADHTGRLDVAPLVDDSPPAERLPKRRS